MPFSFQRGHLATAHKGTCLNSKSTHMMDGECQQPVIAFGDVKMSIHRTGGDQ